MTVAQQSRAWRTRNLVAVSGVLGVAVLSWTTLKTQPAPQPPRHIESQTPSSDDGMTVIPTEPLPRIPRDTPPSDSVDTDNSIGTES